MLALTTASVAEPPSRAVEKFGYRYLALQEGDSNIAFSPLSIHAAFAMLCMGAGTDTYKQTREALHLEENFASPYKALLKSFKPEGSKLSLAARLWPSNNFTLLKSFEERCRSVFGAEPELLDYSKTEQARSTINAWVADITEQQITELIPKGGVDSQTTLVLSNALYFEGPWDKPFPEKKTGPSTFYAPEGAKEVPTMQGRFIPIYYDEDDFTAVELPYEDWTYAMAIVVPRSPEGWRTLGQNLPEHLLQNLRSAREGLTEADYSFRKLELRLPKFSIKQASEPIPLLRELGMKSLFNAPDLSRMSPESGLRVGNCFHQAVVEVDEKGTKAAAATAVVVLRAAPRVVKTVVVDRPFFFIIYHTETLTPLFMGRVVDPAAS